MCVEFESYFYKMVDEKSIDNAPAIGNKDIFAVDKNEIMSSFKMQYTEGLFDVDLELLVC